jgi:hypothetical protein
MSEAKRVCNTKEEYMSLIEERFWTFPVAQNGICLYRWANHGCIVGILFPDDHPLLDVIVDENKNSTSMFDHHPELVDMIPDGVTVDQLHELQDLHDFNWRERTEDKCDEQEFLAECRRILGVDDVT